MMGNDENSRFSLVNKMKIGQYTFYYNNFWLVYVKEKVLIKFDQVFDIKIRLFIIL